MKVIEIEKLVVAYDEDTPVLDNFNLDIENLPHRTKNKS